MAVKRKAITRDSPTADEVLLTDGGDDVDIGSLNDLISESGDEDENEEEEEFGQDIHNSDEEFSEGDDDFEDEDEADQSDSEVGELMDAGSPVTTPDDDKPNYKITTDANGNPRYIYDEIDPVYDSDDSALETTNTIGNIPLSFYDNYPHIGYDINGRKITRPAKGEALDQLLDSIDIPKGWTGLTDPATGKPLQLSQDELELLKRVQLGEAPEEGYDPYPELIEWFTSKQEIMPLSSAPEPKRRFVPSKHEQKRVMKLVKAIREGRIQPYKPPEERAQEEDNETINYDIWADEAPRPDHIMNIPAPKLAPPVHEESYNPPKEYLPDEKEKQDWKEADEEDRDREYLPTSHDALRKVPGYDNFVKEKFERCLDLYLAPRVRRNKLNIDPESLLPKLPSPEELRPFPSSTSAVFRGHKGRVRSVAIDPSGFWAATGGDDGTVRVWDLSIGKHVWHVQLGDGEAINVVQWRPGRDAFILSAACGDDIFLAIPPLCNPEMEAASRAILDAGWGYATASSNGAANSKVAAWARPGSKLENAGILVRVPLRQTVKHISWHRRGEYLVTVSPDGQSGAVAVLTLSKHLTQFPFRKPKGKAQAAHFHPSRPVLFVATQKAIRSWDLSKSVQLKKIIPGATWISGFSVHPGGDNLLVSSYDKRLLWHDLELSDYPHKTLRYHSQAIRSAKFHQSFPLFADASDDGTLQVFHGRVANDAMENATIVPLKMLRGHKVVQRLGVLSLDWMNTQPWLLSAGADGTARLWT